MDAQTIALISLGVAGANFCLNWGVAFYVHLINKDKVTNEKIKEIREDFDDKLDSHSDRIARLEVLAKNAPKHADLEKIHEKINEVAGSLKELKGEFNGATRTLQLIHETLMERGK